MSHKRLSLVAISFSGLRVFRYLPTIEYGMQLAQFKSMIGKLNIMAIALAFISCGRGGSENAIRTVISGQQLETRVQTSRCFYAGPSGGLGGASSPLTCQMSFRTQGQFADELTFVVDDPISVYQNFLSQWINIDQRLLTVYMRLQGQDVAIFDGVFAFDQISNVAGGPVCGQYEMSIGAGSGGSASGSFCMNVDTGFR